MLTIGQDAPLFEAKDQNGTIFRLQDWKGKKIVLYFYPKDDTSGCTAQACSLRDAHDLLQSAGFQVVGVSSDDQLKHQKFIQKYDLPFMLIADTDKKVHELYGTWGEKKMYGKSYMGTLRTTFLIDENGKIADIITKVKTKEHAKQILK